MVGPAREPRQRNSPLGRSPADIEGMINRWLAAATVALLGWCSCPDPTRRPSGPAWIRWSLRRSLHRPDAPVVRRRPRVELYPWYPGIDTCYRLAARLAVRRRIVREGARIYLDSLLAHTDSAIVRWPDQKRGTLRIRIEPDTTLAQWSPSMIDAVRSGMSSWRGNQAGIQLVEAVDSLPADITVRFAQILGTSEFGATDLSWDNTGEITTATIRIAIKPDQAPETSCHRRPRARRGSRIRSRPRPAPLG